MTRQTTMVIIRHSEKIDSSTEMSEMQLQVLFVESLNRIPPVTGHATR